MDRLRSSILPVMLLALLVGVPLHGQGVKKIAQTGMKWLSIPIGARASSMGSAFTAVANDASAVFWNPAGLAHAGNSVFLGHNAWIADIGVNAGSATLELGNLGVFGVSFAAADWGDINGTVRDPLKAGGYSETGKFSPTDVAAGVSYARKISDQFAIGAHARYILENLGSSWEGSTDTDDAGDYTDATEFEAKMNVVSVDFGTMFYTGFKDLRLGMTLQNFSQESRYRLEWFSLPLTFKFGVAMDVLQLLGDMPGHSLTVAVDALHPRDYTERVHIGGEYSFADLVFLRGGYKTNYDEESLSFGGGINVSMGNLALGVDYSMLQFGNFDPVNIFSFNFKF